MRNLMLTFCLSLMASLAFSQIHVTGPNGGDVGIGITSPERKMHIRGTSGIARIDRDRNSPGFIIAQYNEGFNKCINSYFVGTSVRNGKGSFEINDLNGKVGGGGTRVLLIDDDGSLIVGSGATETNYKLRVEGKAFKASGGSDWDIPSDKRLKSNIKSFNSGLDLILKMNPVSYEYNGLAGTQKGASHKGVLAQELQEIAPWMVSKFNYNAEHGPSSIDGESDVEVEKGEYLSVNTSSLQWVMVNAFKEQQQIIEQQNETINELKTALNDLTVVVNGLQVNPSGINSTIDGSGKAYLEQNSPNPLKDHTHIEYYIPDNSRKAFLSVHNISGQQIKKIDITETGKGFIQLKVKDLPAGIYSYRLNIGGNTVDTKKMIIE